VYAYDINNYEIKKWDNNNANHRIGDVFKYYIDNTH